MKKTLALLLAGLLLVSVTACGGDENTNDPQETGNDISTGETGLAFEGTGAVTGEAITWEEITDEQGNIVTPPADGSIENLNEASPEFEEKEMTLIVWVDVGAIVRADTSIDSKELGKLAYGTEVAAIAESEKWYQITYKDADGQPYEKAYLSKAVAGDKAVIDAFQELDKPVIVELTGGVNVRTYPKAVKFGSFSPDYNKIGSLEAGEKVTCVAVGENWIRILYEVTLEDETTAGGKPKTEIVQCYITNEYIKDKDAIKLPETEAVTQAVTEGATEVAATEAEVAATEATT